ncbi:hypothetical protein BpHYR1_019640 [Brachionus plicatilis]|uniref:Uncharacterized protein n=1 Tax=Brachionus plicatilis TaxID=10195 RepID=A0A3M7Q4Z6_BRAPC|nr:hypothetical protein BpHYR1_019640 [Brachionus plicatilis]
MTPLQKSLKNFKNDTVQLNNSSSIIQSTFLVFNYFCRVKSSEVELCDKFISIMLIHEFI